jgi:hypothetical protein
MADGGPFAVRERHDTSRQGGARCRVRPAAAELPSAPGRKPPTGSWVAAGKVPILSPGSPFTAALMDEQMNQGLQPAEIDGAPVSGR